jgi:hypothetical protein
MNVLELDFRNAEPVSWNPALDRGAISVSQEKREATLIDWPLPEPEWKPAVEERLRRLQAYSRGWDGYHGRPPKPSVIAFTRNILQSVMKSNVRAPAIVPLSGGGLQLEWHMGGMDIELAIYAPFNAELSADFSDGRQPVEEVTLSTDFKLLGDLLAELA